jgi:thiamine pyrophosphate-dependent acetolactate synthase large subunit-like protein
MKAYEAFAGGLVSRGINTVFGLIGDGNMYWVSAYAALPDTAWYPAWHEAGAVGMADGYAAATGSVGVATVTMGPGLAQSLGALTAAVRTGRALLLITAEVTENPARQAQSAEQAAWVEACGAAYLRVRTPADLEPKLDEALAIAGTGRPCVLAVVVDGFDAEIEGGFGAAPAAATPPPLVDSDDLTRAVELLANAQAPIVLLGRGALTAGAVDSIGDLGRRLGAAFATTVGGKGALGDDPFQLGVLGMMSNPFARSLVGAADVVLLVGAALDLYNSDGGHLFGDAAIVRIDQREPSALWDPAPDRVIHLTGDAGVVVAALASRLGDRRARAGLRTDETRAGLKTELVRQAALGEAAFDDGPNPWDVVAVLDEQLPADAYFVVGIGHFWYFLAPYLHSAISRRFQFGCGFALIGQALPLAIGAAVASPGGLVVAFEGDGSMAMNLPELQSAVRFGHDLLVIVLDNAGYGSEYHKLLRSGLDERDSAFDAPIDLVAVAQAMGVTARRAHDSAAVRDGLTELLAVGGVRLLVVSIAMSPMSEVYQRQHG